MLLVAEVGNRCSLRCVMRLRARAAQVFGILCVSSSSDGVVAGIIQVKLAAEVAPVAE